MGNMSPPLMERFVVNELTGCWIYRGNKDGDGYGRVGSTVAHRVYYEQMVGPIPEGKQLDHLCVRRACVNPEHLEPVTPAVNQARSIPYRKWDRPPTARPVACLDGHEFTPENTAWAQRNTPTKVIWERKCRACIARRRRKYRQQARDAKSNAVS